jgi:hypothetical protein
VPPVWRPDRRGWTYLPGAERASQAGFELR